MVCVCRIKERCVYEHVQYSVDGDLLIAGPKLDGVGLAAGEASVSLSRCPFFAATMTHEAGLCAATACHAPGPPHASGLSFLCCPCNLLPRRPGGGRRKMRWVACARQTCGSAYVVLHIPEQLVNAKAASRLAPWNTS